MAKHTQSDSQCDHDHATEPKKKPQQIESKQTKKFSLMMLLVILTNTTSILCTYFAVGAEAHRVRSEASAARVPKKGTCGLWKTLASLTQCSIVYSGYTGLLFTSSVTSLKMQLEKIILNQKNIC